MAAAPKVYDFILGRLNVQLEFIQMLKVYSACKSLGSCSSHPYNICDIKKCVTT